MATDAELQTSAGNRPLEVDLLITDFGNYLNLPGLTFDDQDQLTLDIEGNLITLVYVGGATGILLQAEVGELDETPGINFFIGLNDANHISYPAGLGVVTVDTEAGVFLWSERIMLEGLTLEMLDEAVKRGAQSASAWKTCINALLSEPNESEIAEEEMHSIEDFTASIRV